ncbi:MAG: HAD family hydrolase [Phycisphaerae bacterium]|nr:HAD family hydrolase [Phycisphaerae bacterium]
MKIKAILFDLDGTITRPVLDFDLIRREIGGVEGPILEAMGHMTAEGYRRAEEILLRHEFVAAEDSQLNHGVHKLWEWMRSHDLKIGLVTRNQRSSVARICELHDLSFDAIFTREDGPAKPDPFAVQSVCGQMAIDPHDTLMVGDHLFDLVCGRRAGAGSVLITTNQDHRDYHHEADYVIDSLTELPAIVEGIDEQ